MRNYLEEIEKEYSQIRGKWSPLSPVDWNLAAEWEKKEIPLHIVLAAMGDAHLKFTAQKRPGTINTLRYFEQAVETRFAAYLETQVGKYQIGVAGSPTGDQPVVFDTYLCLKCRHYENNSDDFYDGFCKAEGTWKITDGEKYPDIWKARERCNPECEADSPEHYFYFEEK